jgi:hypothetical protein
VARCGGQRPLDMVAAPQSRGALGSQVAGGQRGANPGVGALERMRAGGLHGVQPWLPAHRAELDSLAQPRGARARQCAAAHLDDYVIHGRARQLRRDLVGDGLAALDRQAVLVALAGERHGPAGKLLPQPQVGGVPGCSWLARARHDVAAEPAQPGHDARVRVHRNEHAQPARPGPRHDGRGERRVPAARDREAAALRRGGQPDPLGDLEVDQQPHEVAALVRPRDVTGLVLDPHPAARREPEPFAQQGAPVQRRDQEAAGVHGRHRPPQVLDQPEVPGVAKPAVRREVIGAHQRPVAGERVGLAAAGEAQRRGVEDADQHVVDVVAAGVRAPEGERLGVRHGPAAPGAAQGRQHGFTGPEGRPCGR